MPTLPCLIKKALTLSGEADLEQQIAQACREGLARIFHTDDGGVLVLKLIWDEHGTQGVLVWLAAGTGRQIHDGSWRELVKLAQLAGARFIEFRTKRRGLIRKSQRYGFSIVAENNGFWVARCSITGVN